MLEKGKRNNRNDLTFEEWTDILERIYGKQNKRRTPSEMWLRAVSDASKVGEAVRKMEPHEAMVQLTHTFAWILSTTYKLLNTEFRNQPAIQTYDNKPHTSLTGIILSKYPERCPYCGNKPCICPSKKRAIEKEDKQARRMRLLQYQKQLELNGIYPRKISEISSMFYGIYGEVNYGQSIETITYHFFEEIGEVAWCITSLEEGFSRNKDSVSINIQLAEEIADVVGWGMAVINRLADLAKQAHRLASVLSPPESCDEINSHLDYNLLSHWLWHIFYDENKSNFVCHTCKNIECNCDERI